METRYSRNITTLSEEENTNLQRKKVLVLGCGGLGGYVLEMLARLGVGHLTALDGDVFEASNLNRQILSNEEVLGLSKTAVAVEHLKKVNSQVHVVPLQKIFKEENARDICAGHDVIVDALDNIPSRLLLERTAEELGIPFVHGAIAGWYGQVSTVLPGDRLLSRLYGDNIEAGAEKELGNPSFTPALIAALEVSEVVKLLIGRGDLLRNRIFYLDTLKQEFLFL